MVEKKLLNPFINLTCSNSGWVTLTLLTLAFLSLLPVNEGGAIGEDSFRMLEVDKTRGFFFSSPLTSWLLSKMFRMSNCLCYCSFFLAKNSFGRVITWHGNFRLLSLLFFPSKPNRTNGILHKIVLLVWLVLLQWGIQKQIWEHILPLTQR